MRYRLGLVAILSVLTGGWSGRRELPSARQLSAASQADPQRPSLQETAIPGDVSFSIVRSSTIPGVKRTLDVRLNKKVPEQVLRAIALKLKAQDRRTYQRTFIAYYLPGMAIGAGAWATTRFNPGLEVRILGLTVEDERKLVAQPEPAGREVIGRWLEEKVGSRITIFREGGNLFIEQVFKDGSSFKKQLVESESPHGRRFDMVGGSSTGDHWVLGSDGNLQIHDNDGLIATAKRIR